MDFNFIVFVSLLALGYFAGSWAERQHYVSIEEREETLLQLPVVTGWKGYVEGFAHEGVLVQGSAVISVDYFKRILAALRNIFGGTIRSYETLIDRARREAVLRMKEAAPEGTRIIVNVRVETSTIGKNSHQKSVGCVEALAYGTALVMSRQDEVRTPPAP